MKTNIITNKRYSIMVTRDTRDKLVMFKIKSEARTLNEVIAKLLRRVRHE